MGPGVLNIVIDDRRVVICGGICNRLGEVVVIETIKQVLAPQ